MPGTVYWNFKASPTHTTQAAPSILYEEMRLPHCRYDGSRQDRKNWLAELRKLNSVLGEQEQEEGEGGWLTFCSLPEAGERIRAFAHPSPRILATLEPVNRRKNLRVSATIHLP